MKKITLIAIALISLASCTTTTVDVNAETSHRIITKESRQYEGVSYQIMEVDGHEFLCQYHGGMCLIPKDTIK